MSKTKLIMRILLAGIASFTLHAMQQELITQELVKKVKEVVPQGKTACDEFLDFLTVPSEKKVKITKLKNVGDGNSNLGSIKKELCEQVQTPKIVKNITLGLSILGALAAGVNVYKEGGITKLTKYVVAGTVTSGVVGLGSWWCQKNKENKLQSVEQLSNIVNKQYCGENDKLRDKYSKKIEEYPEKFDGDHMFFYKGILSSVRLDAQHCEDLLIGRIPLEKADKDKINCIDKLIEKSSKEKKSFFELTSVKEVKKQFSEDSSIEASLDVLRSDRIFAHSDTEAFDYLEKIEKNKLILNILGNIASHRKYFENLKSDNKNLEECESKFEQKLKTLKKYINFIDDKDLQEAIKKLKEDDEQRG